MVNCRYTVTADIYEDLIELQIRLKNRTPSQQLKFWPLQQQRVAGPFGCFSRGCRQNEPSADT